MSEGRRRLGKGLSGRELSWDSKSFPGLPAANTSTTGVRGTSECCPECCTPAPPVRSWEKQHLDSQTPPAPVGLSHTSSLRLTCAARSCKEGSEPGPRCELRPGEAGAAVSLARMRSPRPAQAASPQPRTLSLRSRRAARGARPHSAAGSGGAGAGEEGPPWGPSPAGTGAASPASER